jgi:radical SAM protein with 4Fe4S-binding SPASM domain
MKFSINKNNYKSLAGLTKLSLLSAPDKLEIKTAEKISDLAEFKKFMNEIYRLLDQEKKVGIWLVDFPYCVVSESSRDHVLVKNKNGDKANKCKNCLYYKICPGFPRSYFKKYGNEELKIIKNLPKEVMIEVEPKCNFSCHFCFNYLSFSSQGRDIASLKTTAIKKIINQISKLGISTIRFTGGEPLLRNDIFELFKYAKTKGLNVWLNTNGSLINKNNIRKFENLVDNVLIPIESWDDKNEDELTGYKNSLALKIKAIKLLSSIKIPVIRVGTVATKKALDNFDKIYRLIKSLPVKEWEFYRPITGSGKYKVKSKKLISDLVENIDKARNKSDIYISIANSLPFCAIKEPSKLNLVSSGALYEDGHNRLVVDPRGFVKPHYFFEKNIGDYFDILKAWNNIFMKKMRNLEFLPVECRDCRFKYKCRGGSRFEAMMANEGVLKALDPLACPKNIKT